MVELFYNYNMKNKEKHLIYDNLPIDDNISFIKNFKDYKSVGLCNSHYTSLKTILDNFEGGLYLFNVDEKDSSFIFERFENSNTNSCYKKFFSGFSISSGNGISKFLGVFFFDYDNKVKRKIRRELVSIVNHMDFEKAGVFILKNDKIYRSIGEFYDKREK